MRLVIAREEQDLAMTAARLIARQVLTQHQSVLALPTGDTPRRMYDTLVALEQHGVLDLSGVTAFNLDEYLELAPDDPRTFRLYMVEHLWERLAAPPAGWHIPRSDAADETAECAAYEEALYRAGGIDLAVLGIGVNGHIGFNEPGTPWDLGTHVVELAQSTRRNAAPRFGGLDSVPRRAISMGIKTIMRSGQIVLLASGEGKAEVLARALFGPVTIEVPASVLQLHPRLTVVVDQRAASRGLTVTPARPHMR